VVLWTVQRSASGVITALNIAYDVEESRSRLKREAIALVIALGGLAFLLASLFLIAVVPLLATSSGQGPLLGLGRWPLLALLFMLGLALLYRYAPTATRRGVPGSAGGR
jgi:membrane protein